MAICRKLGSFLYSTSENLVRVNDILKQLCSCEKLFVLIDQLKPLLKEKYNIEVNLKGYNMIEVTKTILLKINGQNVELTDKDAEELYYSLGRILNKNTFDQFDKWFENPLVKDWLPIVSYCSDNVTVEN